jgi:hypothetical protein
MQRRRRPEHVTLNRAVRRNKSDYGRFPLRKMGKAAILVMLQPPAPAREPTAWMHAPSQPLMRSPLSQFQTPTAPRRNSRLFRVWLLFRLPWRADHPAYFGLARFISPILSAVDGRQTKQLLHRCQCKSQGENEISVDGIVENQSVKFRSLCSCAHQPISKLSGRI